MWVRGGRKLKGKEDLAVPANSSVPKTSRDYGGEVLFGDTTIKMARKPVKKQLENRAGCAGEGKQTKGNIGEEKMT